MNGIKTTTNGKSSLLGQAGRLFQQEEADKCDEAGDQAGKGAKHIK